MNQMRKQSFGKLEKIRRKFLKSYFFESLISAGLYKRKEEISKTHYLKKTGSKIFQCFGENRKFKILQKQVFFKKNNLLIFNLHRNFKGC